MIPDDVMNKAWRMLSVQPSRNSFSRADVAAFIARALMEAKREERERCIFKAKQSLENEAHDLYAIFEDYVKAKSSGKMGGRNISVEAASSGAVKFFERSDALFMAADRIETDLNPPGSKGASHDQA